MINKKVFILLVFIFFMGLISGSLFTEFISPKVLKYQPTRQKGFQHISPLPYCETAPSENTDLTKKLSQNIEDYITESQDNLLVENVSVYFRIPDFGDWISINESEKYTPASLLKIPTMMVYYKQAGSDPTVLSRKLKFKQDNGNDMENIKSAEQMRPGEEYTIDNLIDRMIVNSDNSAKNLLTLNIDPEDFYNIFEEVGIGRLDYNETENFMNAKQYASFFRILYNASYLNREMSEKALKLLTKVKFDQGITADIPSTLPVAHKFGERSYGISDSKQLHDCGIVYVPTHPYILCVMTRGNSFENLQNIISTIASITYEAVTARKD